MITFKRNGLSWPSPLPAVPCAARHRCGAFGRIGGAVDSFARLLYCFFFWRNVLSPSLARARALSLSEGRHVYVLTRALGQPSIGILDSIATNSMDSPRKTSDSAAYGTEICSYQASRAPRNIRFDYTAQHNQIRMLSMCTRELNVLYATWSYGSVVD